MTCFITEKEPWKEVNEGDFASLTRVELPGPKISKDFARDERVLVQIDRAQFNQLAESGTLRSYRKAWETGQIKANGDSNVLKLVGQVVEKQEQRARVKKAH